MPKISHLQNALNNHSSRPPVVQLKAPAAAPEPPVLSSGRQPNRKDKVNIAAWLDPRFKQSLRLVQARHPGPSSIQSLLEEALNELFAKYDVPQVASQGEA